MRQSRSWTCLLWFVSLQLQAPSGCSPKTVLLSHVDELVCVGVRGAVVLRSLHVSDPSSDGRMEDLMGCNAAAPSARRYCWPSPLWTRLPSAPLRSWSPMKSLSAETSWHLWGFFLWFLHLSFPLWLSSATRSTPGGPWQLRNLLPAWVFCSISDIQSQPLNLSCTVISPLARSVAASQWQSEVGAGLPVLAPPPFLIWPSLACQPPSHPPGVQPFPQSSSVN